MHLETVSEFKVMQSKKNIGYTYFRFEKNAHKELVDRPVAAFNIDGAYLLITFDKTKSKRRVITDEMLKGRLDEVISKIRDEIEVITNSDAERNHIINPIREQRGYSARRYPSPANGDGLKIRS